jgi:hypothetical protein
VGVGAYEGAGGGRGGGGGGGGRVKRVPPAVTVPNYIMKNGVFLYATTNMDHIIATPLFMNLTFMGPCIVIIF